MLGVVALAVALSCAMHWLPVLNTVSSGFSIILCTVLAAAWARWPRRCRTSLPEHRTGRWRK
ncbi:MAG: hypothetical protein ACLRZH_17945 [Ruthenibacterium lactatiformans]